MEEMDRTDRRIVALLLENARLSNKELAAAVGIAPSTCSERLRRLEDRRVLIGYHAAVAPAALGIRLQAMIAIRMRRHHAEEVDSFRAKALSLPEVVAVYHVTGANDFLVHIVVADADHLRRVAVESFSTFPEVAHLETSLIFEHLPVHRLPEFG